MPDESPKDDGRSDLEINADTCSFGCFCHMLNAHGRNVNAMPFLPELGLADSISVVNACAANDDYQGETWLLVFNQVSRFQNLRHNWITGVGCFFPIYLPLYRVPSS